MSTCQQCTALEALKSSTSDKSLKSDCVVMLRRHPDHADYPESITQALRTLQGGER
jgi:hypothetical protein